MLIIMRLRSEIELSKKNIITPEARAEVYKEVDGYTIWKFYEK